MDIELPPSSSDCGSSYKTPTPNSGSIRSRLNFFISKSSQAPTKNPRVKPIILQSVQWRQITPSVYDTPEITLENTFAKAVADGKVWLQSKLDQI